MPSVSVCVVGAGIIGLSSAYRIKSEFPNVDVTVIAERLTPNTTSDGAAGLWEPYLCGATHVDRVTKWCTDTWNYLSNVCKAQTAAKVGVYPISGYSLSSEAYAEPFWSKIVKNYHQLSSEELKEYSPLNVRSGFFFTTFICECRKHLPYLQHLFQSIGGTVKIRRISSLLELINDYDVIINCSGVESYHLVGDTNVFPVKGRVLRVRAPDVKMFYFLDTESGKADESTYIIPNDEDVVLGGLKRKGDWDVSSTNASESQAIQERCSKLVPGLKHAAVLSEWAGLRPGRQDVRLEPDAICLGQRNIPVIHNYGHGGSGVTLFWGCAGEVVNILKRTIPLKANL